MLANSFVICPSVTVMEFMSEFYVKVSPSGYIIPTTHQKAFIHGYLGGSTSFPYVLAPGFMLEVKN